MKKIHFYTNLCNEDQVSDEDLEMMFVDMFNTNKAINDDRLEEVKTTQLYFLNKTFEYLDKGYDVYIHNQDEVFDIRECLTSEMSDILADKNICDLVYNEMLGEIF